MRLLVVTSCTGKKAVKHNRQLVLSDFLDSNRLAQREQELKAAGLARPALKMYTGAQHFCVVRGMKAIRATFGREAIRLAIISAD